MENVIKLEKIHPKEKANILSKIFFGWMIKLCYTGVKTTLKIADLYKCLKSNESQKLTDILEEKWKKELVLAKAKSKKPNLAKVIWKIYAPGYIAIGIAIFIIAGIIRSFQPTVLSLFIKEFSSSGSIQYKLIYGSILVLMSTLIVFSQHQMNLALASTGMKIRITCCSLVYRKLLRVSRKALNETAAGQVVNILSNDVNRFDMVVLFLHFLWIMPLQVTWLTYLIWQQVGISSLAGVLSMLIISIPLQGAIAKYASTLRMKVAQKTDSRIKLMNQLVEGIQVVKMYVWEKALADTVGKIRVNEIDSLTIVSYLRGILSSMSVFMEKLVCFLTILCFVLLGNTITADIAFSLSSFYNILQLTAAIYYPLGMLLLSETKVSVARLETFLMLDEKQESKVVVGNNKEILLKDVKAFWNPDSPVLKQITMNIPAGTLCAVIGSVGAGKSSLLQLLLGELTSYEGIIEIGGKVSYSSQDPWIFASTVRKNILFGEQYDKNRYDEIVDVCALRKDFEQFPHGDKTLVGEKGISLSGGQRARINLARAIYKEADIYLLDDPLSAVDTNVGKHLFDKCILKQLQNKTRILVTHQLQYLKKADYIIVIDNGRIESQGTFDELSQSTLDFTKFLSSAEETIEEENHFERDRLRASIVSKKSENLEQMQLEKNEETQTILKNSPYWQYARYAGNVCLLLILLLLFLLSQTTTSGIDYWISYWTGLESQWSIGNSTTEYSDNFLTTNICLYIYSGLIGGSIILTNLRSTFFYKLAMNASKRLHSAMFHALLQAPMHFFDVNPIGRILNRFSKDMGIIDEVLPRMMLDAITILLVLLGILVNVTISNHWMLIAAVILGVAFYIVRGWYVAVARNVKHLEGITRSPVFSHLSATFNGITSIRASKAESKLAKEFDEHQDTHTSAWFLTIACVSSFGFWLDLITLSFVYCVVYSVIFISEGGSMNSSAVGLAVQQSLILTGMLSFGMRQMAEVVSNMTAVERVLEYTELEKEEEETVKKAPYIDWPKQGTVIFKNVYLRYADDAPAVLKNLNFTIEAGEKVGVVGRTGAGKTSLIAALFRLAKIEGSIFLDDINTKSISLSDLRKKISIIPQEPILFSASLRYNLDPFNEFEDKLLWIALDEVELKQSVTSLEMQVQEGGSNFSVGQRQLICLARAILRNNKILVLDEATANVDPRTDALIQSTIRKKFSSCTVLTIAHRLNTVMDSDKILVMDSGMLMEYDHPHILLQNENGVLHQLVSQTGPTMTTQLHQIAKDCYSKKHKEVTEL